MYRIKAKVEGDYVEKEPFWGWFGPLLGTFGIISFVILTIVFLLIRPAYQAHTFKEEMKKMCVPNHYEFTVQKAEGLYAVSCIDKNGHVDIFYLERNDDSVVIR